MDLDPRSEVPVQLLAESYERMRRYEDAERWQNRSIALDPYEPLFYGGKAHIYLGWEGSVERARGVLQEASGRIDPASVLLPHRILIRIFAEEYAAALDRLTLGAPGVDTVNYFIAKAELNARRDQAGSAHAYSDSARAVLERRVQEQPAAYGRVADELGLAYAGLGRRDEAISAAKTAIDLFPLSQDAWRGPIVVENLAEIYVTVGEYDAAIEQLELLPLISSPLSASLLRVDPLWDPLRDHPRFQALLETYRGT